MIYLQGSIPMDLRISLLMNGFSNVIFQMNQVYPFLFRLSILHKYFLMTFLSIPHNKGKQVSSL